jgi:hypothetical protein
MTDPVAAARQFLSTWKGRAIAAFVVVQLALPATYYLRHDRHDERFSWRMFSTMRMATCSIAMRRAGQPVTLGAEFHEAWIELAKRGRQTVVEAMGAELCRKYPGQEVVADLRCHYLDGTDRAFGGFDLCKVPEL